MNRYFILRLMRRLEKAQRIHDHIGIIGLQAQLRAAGA